MCIKQLDWSCVRHEMQKLKLTGLRRPFQPALTAFPGQSRSAKATSCSILGSPPWSVGFGLLCPYYTPEPGVMCLGSVSLRQLQKCGKNPQWCKPLAEYFPFQQAEGWKCRGKEGQLEEQPSSAKHGL